MGAAGRILDPERTEDLAEWVRLWEASAAQLPFAHPAVAGLLADPGGRLLALTAASDTAAVLYPLVLREAGEGRRDVTSPYGYGGPLVHGEDPDGSLERGFWEFFDAWAHTERVVTEFVRLSLFPDVLDHPGRLRPRTVNYVRELPADESEVAAGCEPKVRQNARRALRAGVTARIVEDDSLLADFERIYLGTMVRLDSAAWYRFDHEFFTALHAGFGGRIAYAVGELDGVPVSMDLLLLGRDTAYYFLGGTDFEAAGARPNDLVKLTAMEWLAAKGYRRYVLGGGVRSGDGLERYKRGFAPQGTVRFSTAERVLDPSGFEALVEVRRAQAGDVEGGDDVGEFFPAYRAPLPEAEVPASAGSTTAAPEGAARA